MQRTLKLPARLLVCAVAAAGSASLAAAAIPAGSASAATPLTLTCTSLSGNQSTQKISGCSGTGKSETGATGTAKVASSNKSATITWSTKKTSVESFTYKDVTPNACPAVTGYTSLLEVSESGSVTGGTATGLKGRKVSGKVCVYDKGSTYLVKSLRPQKL